MSGSDIQKEKTEKEETMSTDDQDLRKSEQSVTIDGEGRRRLGLIATFALSILGLTAALIQLLIQRLFIAG